MQKSLSRYWLLLGVAGLAVAGLYSIVLVVARTPQLASIPFFSNLFHAALVAHVDLSVLAWFLCIACMLWSGLTANKRSPIPFLEEAALIAMGGSMFCITVAPIEGFPAMMSNYIPVIHSPVFFFGLALMLCSVLLMLTKLLFVRPAREPLAIAVYAAAPIAIISIAAFYWAYADMPPEIDGQQYYELLFWGGGHTLQYLHTQLMMVAWLLIFLPLLGGGSRWGLAAHSEQAVTPSLTFPLKGGRNISYILLSILPLLTLTTPLGYLLYEVHTQEHRLFFTNAMILGGGIAPGLLALFLIPDTWRAHAKNALWSALAMSLVLFVYGGILGGAIRGQDVTIPAHYHGVIVGVTLAFMGLAYLKLPEFGYRDPKQWRLAFWQPIVYGGGQLMHITGLAVSGGYGVLRKTPGEVHDVAMSVKVALGFMGLGGLLAIIGGLMFVIVVAKAVFYKD